MHAHDGTMWFEVQRWRMKLNGDYYTGRDRNTTGTVEVTREYF